MSEEIIKGLVEMRERLDNLESIYESKFSELEIRSEINQNTDRRLEKILSYQEDIININVSGHIFTTLKSNFLESKYYNVMKDIIPNHKENEIFYDFDPKFFEALLDILRKSRPDYIDEMNEEEETKVQLREGKIKMSLRAHSKNANMFSEYVLKFFRNDAERVMKDFKITFISKDVLIAPSGEDLTDLIMSYSLTKPYQDDYFQAYVAKTVSDITNDNSRKAFFLEYSNSVLLFTLSKSAYISKMIIKPFDSFPDYWVPSNGQGSKIYSSSDGENWEVLSTIGSEWGNGINGNKITFSFTPRVVKFIKFQTVEYELALSYIKIMS